MNKLESCINRTLNKVTIFVYLFYTKQTQKFWLRQVSQYIYITIKAKTERTKHFIQNIAEEKPE